MLCLSSAVLPWPRDLPRSGHDPVVPCVRAVPSSEHKSCSQTRRPHTQPASKPAEATEASRKGLAKVAAGTIHSAF